MRSFPFIAMVFAVCLMATDARAMTSPGFVNPTGKITCELKKGRNIYCVWRPSGRRVAVGAYGEGYRPDWWGKPKPSDRVLDYGRVWRTAKRPLITCSTYRSGVTCANQRGHGFRIDFQGVQTW